MTDADNNECLVIPFLSDNPFEWDEWVDSSNEGTIFHKKGFLSYHGDRFENSEIFLSIHRKKKRVALWSLALVERNGELCALSPYGGSYGGPAIQGVMGLTACRDIISSVVEHVANAGAKEFRITLPIRACSLIYTETFRFALLEAGFSCVNRDISSVIPLGADLVEYSHVQSHRSEWERRARKASKLGVVVRRAAPIQDFWQTLTATFKKHGMKPTHTFEELQWLAAELPDKVFFSCAYLEEKPIAGVCYFAQNSRVVGTFYLCQDPEYQALQAQSALLLDGFEQAQSLGYCWMDLGTSSVNMQAYDSIFRFKETLGAIGQFRETYMLRLK